MLEVIYAYDVEGWALHNFGLMLKDGLKDFQIDLKLFPASHLETPDVEGKVLFLASMRMLIRREFISGASEVITVIHDPIEISNFADTLSWTSKTLRLTPLNAFSRVAVTTDEMYFQVSSRLSPKICFNLRTPIPSIKFRNDGSASEPLRIGSSIRMSTKELPSSLSGTSIVKRAGARFLRNESGRLSASQLMSIRITSNRKNPRLLNKLSEELDSWPNVLVNFHGLDTPPNLTRMDYLRWLEGLDIYICTSRMEGGPIPVMEAVQRGCAILSTPVGQTADWVLHGRNGFFCLTQEDFLTRIQSYIQNPMLLRAHKAASVDLAKSIKPDFESWATFVSGAAT
jgi:glycosyltransferase involved in cell wall biosynthesis